MPTDQTRSERNDYEEKHAAFERQRTELRAQMAREQRAVNELLHEIEGWKKAKAIRAYVWAVEEEAKRNDTLLDHAAWIAWASDQADRFDPFCDSPLSILDAPRDRYRTLTPDEGYDDDGNIEHA